MHNHTHTRVTHPRLQVEPLVRTGLRLRPEDLQLRVQAEQERAAGPEEAVVVSPAVLGHEADDRPDRVLAADQETCRALQPNRRTKQQEQQTRINKKSSKETSSQSTFKA